MDYTVAGQNVDNGDVGRINHYAHVEVVISTDAPFTVAAAESGR